MAWSSRKDVDRWFPPYDCEPREPGDPVASVAGAIRFAAITVQSQVPASADQSAALRALREALHWSAEAFRVEDLKPSAPEPGPNSYLGAAPPKVDYSVADLQWSSGEVFTWKCPGCDNDNFGRVPVQAPAPPDVKCVHCTASFPVRSTL